MSLNAPNDVVEGERDENSDELAMLHHQLLGEGSVRGQRLECHLLRFFQLLSLAKVLLDELEDLLLHGHPVRCRIC